MLSIGLWLIWTLYGSDFFCLRRFLLVCVAGLVFDFVWFFLFDLDSLGLSCFVGGLC
jgi:hypothetical protein